MSAWITDWRDWADNGHDGIPLCSHLLTKSGCGTERLLKDFKPKWRAAQSCCVCLCCSPPRSTSAYYSLPRSLYHRTNGLRVSRAPASPRCHGRPPSNGCSSVCLSLWGLRRVYVLSTAAILIYNFRDAQNNTVDNIWQLSACEFPLLKWLMQNSCLCTTSYQLWHAGSIIYGWVNELWAGKKSIILMKREKP